MYAVLRTDGELKINEIYNECKRDKWAPILSFTRKSDTKIVVPFFHQPKDAKTFAKRNLPPEWVHGAVRLTQQDIEWMQKQGWEIEVFDFPKKLKDRADIELGISILEFQSEPIVNGIKI